MLILSAVRSILQFQRLGHILPWMGPVLRGGFGGVLRELSCRVSGIECTACPLVMTCAYGYLFETPVRPRIDSPVRYTHAPHPFITKTPMLDEVRRNQLVPVDLILVGKATEYLPYFLIAMKELGRRGLGKERIPYSLVETSCLKTGLLVDEHTGLGGELAFALNLPESGTAGIDSAGKTKIILCSPMRIKAAGEPMRRFSFHRFVLSIVSRVEDLAWYHCGKDLRGSMRHLLEESHSINVAMDETQYVDAWRGSSRQKRFIPVGGLVGQATLDGNLAPFSGLFQAAQLVGVGNKTSFGLGAVRFEPSFNSNYNVRM